MSIDIVYYINWNCCLATINIFKKVITTMDLQASENEEVRPSDIAFPFF